MAPSTLALFLTALVFAGAKAANKDLGEACASADTCVHPTLELVCDDVTSTCRIKDKKACDGDGHSDLCVTGATCDGTVCGCEGTVYTSVSATGKCVIPANLWGATCASDGSVAGDCTATSGLACPSGATKCQCEADKKVDLSTGKCTGTIDSSKVGKACTNQDACGEVGTTFMTCVSSKCACQDGYSGTTGGDCAEIAASKVGKACTAGTAATDCGAQATTNLECGSSPAVCGCVANYYGVPGGVCYPAKGQLDGGCTATADCSVAMTVCAGSTAKKCECKSGYSANAAGTACEITAEKVGGSCTITGGGVNVQGSCDDDYALCSAAADGTCFCKTGYTGTDGAGCVVTANTFGGACTGGPNVKGTCVDANAVCSLATAGTCDCKATYSGAIGASCVAANKIGGGCTGDADTQASCEDTNALCKSSFCMCKPGYDGSAGGTCTKIADNTFGGSCTTDTPNAKGTCVDANAECPLTTGGFCTCKTNYDGYAGSGCAMANKVGGKCTTMTKGTKGTCEADGAVCSMQVDGRCVMSGAKAVVASVTSLVLACIVCLLAIN